MQAKQRENPEIVWGILYRLEHQETHEWMNGRRAKGDKMENLLWNKLLSQSLHEE